MPLGLVVETNVLIAPQVSPKRCRWPRKRLAHCNAVRDRELPREELTRLRHLAIEGVAQLAPAVSENSPNQGTTAGSVGQVIINGAFGFPDNVF